MVIIVVALTCQKLVCGICIVKYGDIMAFPLGDLADVCDIFITHCPPRGVNDEEELAHQGWDWLRDYVLKRKPKILLHGHTYPTEDNLVKKLGNTKIEYVHGWKIINI